MEFGFIFKKVISAFVMPLSIGVIFTLIGLFFLYKNSNKKAKIFLTVGTLWIIIFSYVPVSNLLLAPLEQKYSKLENIPKNVKYILLLGGDMQNRGWEALRLYNNIEDAKIITSGYAGRGEVAEAIQTANILEKLGVDKSDILVYPEPKDTKEEALKIKEVLGKAAFILVTSAYHMPRAISIFNEVGLYPIAAPTDFLIKDSDKVLSAPTGGNMQKSEIAWHEYLGLIWASIKK